MANRIHPIRIYIPDQAGGGYVDLNIPEQMKVEEVKKEISRIQSKLSFDFKISNDEQGTEFYSDSAILMDPSNRISFDIGCGKMIAWLRLCSGSNHFTGMLIFSLLGSNHV